MRPSGYSFCIITNGARPEKLAREIESIHALEIPQYEILVAGDVSPGLDRVEVLSVPDAARNGRLGELRNHLIQRTKYDHLIVADEDIIFHQGFFEGLQSFGEDYDVLCPRVLNPDGTRFWDWATAGGIRGHILLDYNETDPCIYPTGEFCILKSYVAEKVLWDDRIKSWTEGNIAFSKRLKQAGFSIRHCSSVTVTRDNPRYTQIGKMAVDTSQLKDFAEIGQGIIASGAFEEQGASRWMGRMSEWVIWSHQLSTPMQLSFDVVCAQAEQYQVFPFELKIKVDHQPYQVLIFRRSGERKKICIDIEARNFAFSLQTRSSSSYSDLRGRELSFCVENLSFSPLRSEETCSMVSCRRNESLSDLAAIHWTSPLFDYSAEAAISRGIVSSLANHGAQLCTNSLGQNKEFLENLKSDSAERKVWESRNSVKCAKGVQILFHPPVMSNGVDFYNFQRRSSLPQNSHVGITMCGADRVPARWVEICNQMDRIWVPGEFNKEVFTRSGVASDKVKSIQFGVDCAEFDPEQTSPLSLSGTRSFNFLSVFRWETRKGWDILLRAYLQAFSSSDDVSLTLRTYASQEGELDIPKEITVAIEALGYRMEEIPPISLYTDVIPQKYFPALYKAANAFVLPSRGEGWGLPLMEAMAMSLPVISTSWGAPLEFLNEDNALLVERGELKALEGVSQSGDAQLWADPSWEHTAALMRELYENKAKGIQKGKIARNHIKENFSIEKSVESIKSCLDELSGCRSVVSESRESRMDETGSNKQVSSGAKKKTLKSVEVGGDSSSFTLGIDARTLVFSESLVRGIGQYSSNHLLQVIEKTPQWDYVLCLEQVEHFDSLTPFLSFPNVECISFLEAGQRHFDLFHIPDPMSTPRGFDSPFRMVPHAPLSVTFYDLIPLVERELYLDTMSSFEHAAYVARMKQLKSSNAHILAISENTKNDLCYYLDIPESQISVIQAGINQAETRSLPSTEVLAEVKHKFNIIHPFFLSVGSLEPHKNFLLTLHAFSAASQSRMLQLVVVGTLNDPYKRNYKMLLEKNGVTNVVFTGYLTREELEALYSSSAALVFPSRYEGFGLPVIEAMARNCPVITSTTSSLPEIAGEAALYVDPDDTQALTDSLLRIASDSTLRQELIGKGTAQSKRFTWAHTADLTISAWKRLLLQKT